MGLMPLADILRLDSPDAAWEEGAYTVGDTLAAKRASAAYPRILASVREHGITVPVWIVDGELREGHHRVAAAVDLGLDVLPWSSVELTAAGHWPST
jgi:hypothetical protein